MIENVAATLSAFVKRNPVPAPELPALIASVSESLASLGSTPAAAPETATPAVSIRQSVRPDYLVCLACG
jgi:predicted transcriptional regulator